MSNVTFLAVATGLFVLARTRGVSAGSAVDWSLNVFFVCVALYNYRTFILRNANALIVLHISALAVTSWWLAFFALFVWMFAGLTV